METAWAGVWLLPLTPRTIPTCWEPEAAYAGLEVDLQSYLDTYESTHDYDEYHFDLDGLEHDPYVLLSILSALHEDGWTLADVEDDLQALFDRQYILTERVVVETRHDSEGNSYSWSICYVTLENKNLSHLPIYIMSEEQEPVLPLPGVPGQPARPVPGFRLCGQIHQTGRPLRSACRGPD